MVFSRCVQVTLCLIIFKCLLVISANNTECPMDKPVWTPFNKTLLLNWLMENSNTDCNDDEVEYPSYDGWYHNLAKIDLGSVGQPILKGWKGIQTDNSLAENWSKTLNEIHNVSAFSLCNSSSDILSVYFSKQLLNEIMHTKSSPFLDQNMEQINYASSYIDGAVIYGTNPYIITEQILSDGTINIDKVLAMELENINYGELKVSFFLRVVWLRWHNYLAKRIHEDCLEWSTKKVFDEARKWTIAVQQSVYVYNWLPLRTNKALPIYLRYDPSIDPQIMNIFLAAVEVVHSIQDVEPSIFCEYNKTCELSENNATDKLLSYLKNTTCSNLSFCPTNQYLQQKYQLPDINHTRSVLGLNPYLDQNDLNNSSIFSKFTNSDLKHLDDLLGGALESKIEPGELFAEIIVDQFRRIRDGDRFWFENKQNNLFSCEQVVRIRQITLAEVISIALSENSEYNFYPRSIENSSFEYSSQKQWFGIFLSLLLGFIFLVSEEVCVMDDQKKKKFNIKIIWFTKDYNFIRKNIGGEFLGTSCTVGLAFCLILIQKNEKRKLIQKKYSITRQTLVDDWQTRYPLFPVHEYIGSKEALRKVVLILKKDRNQVTIQSFSGTILRVIDLNTVIRTVVKVIHVCDEPTLIIQVPHNYDLVLKFESSYLRDALISDLDSFIAGNAKLEKELITNVRWKTAKSIIVTKEQRQMWLEMFFRVAFAQAFKIPHSQNEMLKVDAFVAKEVIYTELTVVEFADALSMHPDNEFVKRIFALVDKDKNGFISFREFVDLIIIFAEGSKETKAKLLFDLYDINGTGLIPANEFSAMIKSFLETVGGTVQDVDIKKTIGVMLRSAGVENKTNLDFNDFLKIIGDDINHLNYAKLGFRFQRKDGENTYLAQAKKTIEEMYRKRNDLATRFQSFGRIVDQNQEQTVQLPIKRIWICDILLFLELQSKQIFWIVFSGLLFFSWFLQRFYFLEFIVEDKPFEINVYVYGLIKEAKYAVVATFALLFVTMCRNIFNKIRYILNDKYFPYDRLTQIHAYAAHLLAMFSGIHVAGEIWISSIVIFKSYDRDCEKSNQARDQYTFSLLMEFLQNPVVITGFGLIILLFIVHVFALQLVRKKLSSVFYITHYLYPLITLLLVIHCYQLSSPIIFWILPGPLLLFVLDLLVTSKRKKMEIPVERADFSPSNVISLVFRRPKNFQYKVGQWIRLAIPQINSHEFHLFTLSTAPHEAYLQIHIQPTTTWSRNVYGLFEGPGSGYAAAPVRVLLDGPFGNGMQHWRLYDVVVLVGGGNGVAPFASMLKDVSYALHNQEHLHCQKVYFIWVTKTQKRFEWMVDLIQDAENNDPKHYLSCHIFITQFYEKFDLRTIMLYISEKHYQRISGKSLFTNLAAVTHFGRPSLPDFFKTVQGLHPTAKYIGVFSSGPTSLTQGVDDTCRQLNIQSHQRFEHNSNNF